MVGLRLWPLPSSGHTPGCRREVGKGWARVCCSKRMGQPFHVERRSVRHAADVMKWLGILPTRPLRRGQSRRSTWNGERSAGLIPSTGDEAFGDGPARGPLDRPNSTESITCNGTPGPTVLTPRQSTCPPPVVCAPGTAETPGPRHSVAPTRAAQARGDGHDFRNPGTVAPATIGPGASPVQRTMTTEPIGDGRIHAEPLRPSEDKEYEGPTPGATACSAPIPTAYRSYRTSLKPNS